MTAPLCDQVRSRFDDYHDGLLSSELSESVKVHLLTCESCREEYGLLVACIGVIRRIEVPAVPPRTLRKIVDTLSHPPLPGPDLEHGLETI